MNREGFFFVTLEPAVHLKQIKLVTAGLEPNINIEVGTMNSDCKDMMQNVAKRIFHFYDCAVEYAQEVGGKVYHCIPDFKFFLGTALEITGVTDDGGLISIDNAIEQRAKHFEDHYMVQQEEACK